MELFGQLLRQRGVDPDAVSDVDAAWAAFTEFVQTPLDGIVTGEDSDADGFIVQWGCWSWNGKRPGLAFTRQLAVPDQDDPAWQPSIWHVELEMTFAPQQSLTGLDELNESDTGFSFDPIGEARGIEFAEFRQHYPALYPQLAAMWGTRPAASKLSMYQAD